ncbi:MAG: type II CAAX endopeptidase family protein [Pyrinomonadaceae bacterium]
MEFNLEPTITETEASMDISKRHSPDNPPWGAIVGIGFWILSVFFILFFNAAFILLYSKYAGALKQEEDLFRPDVVIVVLLSTIPAHLNTLAVAILIVFRFGKYKFDDVLGSRLNGFNIFHLVGILIPLYGIIFGLSHFLGVKETAFQKLISSSNEAMILMAVIGTLSAPIVEEVVYRGILFGGVVKKSNNLVGVIVVTTLFAAVHFPQYREDAATLISITIVSLALTLVRVYWKSLMPCIIVHFVFNGIQSLVLLAQMYGPK